MRQRKTWRQNIYEHRRLRGWSQGELGRRARPHSPISHSTISGIETGRTDPAVSTVEDIASAFGLTLADLVVPDPALVRLQKRERQDAMVHVSREAYQTFERLVGEIIDSWQKLLLELQDRTG